MDLPEKALSIDLEGIEDGARNSWLTVVACLLAMVGLFAIVAPPFTIFCVASAVIGLIVIGFSRRWGLAPTSVRFAFASILVSLFSGLAGVAYQLTANRIVLTKATEVATNYVLALAKGDRATAIAMTGLPQMVEDEELGNAKKNREQMAVREFLADPVIQDVIKLGKNAVWKSTGLKAKFREGEVFEFAIGFINEKATNPRTYIVTVKQIPPGKYAVETRNQWFVDSINLAPF